MDFLNKTLPLAKIKQVVLKNHNQQAVVTMTS